MAFGEIKINIDEVESKIKILYKHLGNMIEEFDRVCKKCGSTDTEMKELKADDNRLRGIRICNSCDTNEYY